VVLGGANDQELPDAGAIELSVVVPFYNPGPRLPDNVRAIVEALDGTALTYEVVTVSDGSTDGSAEAVADIGDERLRRIELARNVGKGEALRVGLSQGRGRYLGFIDADGDIPARLLPSFVDAIRTGSVDIVVASKRHRESSGVYPPLRRFYSWAYQQLVRLLFHLDVQDTQTGLKILRREVVEVVLPETFEKRFAFDLEVLVLARLHGFDRVQELPVRIERRFVSTISPRAVAGIIADTFTIWWRLKVRRARRAYRPRKGDF
jgi:glycosyltransferase involved in cell wall biosynthesis